MSLLPGSRFSMMKVACTNPAGTPLVAGTGFGVHRDGMSMGSVARVSRRGAHGQWQPVGAVAQRVLRAENRGALILRPQFTLGAG